MGFEDMGEERKLRIADHALVLLLKGIRKKWKQPICYYFSQGGFNAIDLKNILKSTIEALQRIGFNIIATVCDQYSANTNAIKQLVQSSGGISKVAEYKFPLFVIGNQEIVAIYDPPHLLKGIRNNFVKNNIKFYIEGIEKTASWKDIQQLYELDVGDFNTRMCYKLTDSHIYEDKMKKMKVKHAAQVLSHRVSSTLRWTVKFGRKDILNVTAEDTADFVSLMDQLFDSVNGSTCDAEHGKELRCAIKNDSPHFPFWKKIINILRSARFISEKGETIPPSLSNWIKAIHGFMYIWDKLSKMGFKYLCPRSINQDPLENLFGCIRSHGIRNINPSCMAFVSSFKSLIKSNFASPHSPGANCENDDNFALNSLELFLSENVQVSVNIPEKPETFEKIEFVDVEDEAIINTHAYIAGYIARTILKKISKCSVCRNQLLSTSTSSEHELILARQYKHKSLLRPKTQYRRIFTQMVHLFNVLCKKFILKKGIKRNLMAVFKEQLYNPFLCQEHDMFHLYISNFLTFFLFTYIKNINKILKGQISVNQDEKDDLKIIAQNRFQKLRVRKRKVQIIKKLN